MKPTEQAMKDNPELSYEFVRDALIAKAELDAGDVKPYEFGEEKKPSEGLKSGEE